MAEAPRRWGGLTDSGVIRHRLEGDLYVRESSGSSPPRGTIVWIHGLGESGLTFEGLLAAPRLAPWRQLAVDLPGYGKTPWSGEPHGIEELAALVAEWICAAPEPVVLAGHSMGGVIGISACERLGDRVRGFLNVEGNVSFDDCGFSGRAARYTLDEFLAGGFHRILGELYRDGLEDEALATYYPSMRICDPRAYHLNSGELVELSRAEGLAGRMAVLGAASLYVLGDPRGTGAHSRRLLDRAGVVWRAVDNAGHWPFLDQPAVFLDEVVAFLAQLDLGG